MKRWQWWQWWQWWASEQVAHLSADSILVDDFTLGHEKEERLTPYLRHIYAMALHQGKVDDLHMTYVWYRMIPLCCPGAQHQPEIHRPAHIGWALGNSDLEGMELSWLKLKSAALAAVAPNAMGCQSSCRFWHMVKAGVPFIQFPLGGSQDLGTWARNKQEASSICKSNQIDREHVCR